MIKFQYMLYTLENEFIQESRTLPEHFTGIAVFLDVKYWYFNKTLHREDGPAVIEPDSNAWWFNGKLHRTDGPAIEKRDGTKVWLLNGIHYRLDGPAIEYPDGSKFWYVDGKQVTEEQHKLYVDVLKLKKLI